MTTRDGTGDRSHDALFLYLHGFASSPLSRKAKAFEEWAKGHDLPFEAPDLRVPSFESLLFSAMKARVMRAIDERRDPKCRVVLIGSSLGGLTAARVAEADPRVCAVFLMAPAFQIASRWQERLGRDAWDAWQRTGFLDVEDHAKPKGERSRVHFGFVEELARLDAELGPWPDVRVPTWIVHGRQDDVVDIELSRTWSARRRNVRLVEVDDGHELGQTIPTILSNAETFFAPFLNRSTA